MPGMRQTMDEWKKGALHSGSKTGPKVTSQRQAIAIGLSEQRAAKKKGTTKRKGAPAHRPGDLIRRALGG